MSINTAVASLRGQDVSIRRSSSAVVAFYIKGPIFSIWPTCKKHSLLPSTHRIPPRALSSLKTGERDSELVLIELLLKLLPSGVSFKLSTVVWRERKGSRRWDTPEVSIHGRVDCTTHTCTHAHTPNLWVDKPVFFPCPTLRSNEIILIQFALCIREGH